MLSVSETVDLQAPAAEVWKTVGNFGAAASYLEVVDRCELMGSPPGAERVLHLKGGGSVLERLILASDSDKAFRYTIVDSPLPVSDYVSTVRVDALDPQRCRVTWSASFESHGVSDAEAQATIAGIYRMGFDGLKKLHDPS
jgi:mxaD protein